MSRLKVFFNGRKSEGKVITFPSTYADLLETCSSLFNTPITSVFLDGGSKIEDVTFLRDDDTIVVSSTGSYVPEKTGETVEVARCCNVSEVERSDWLTLNVGGKYFTTTRRTLTKYPDSMLGRMFSEDESYTSAVDKSGAYLIDRSPEYFQPLLNYLRQGVLVLNDGINPKGVLEEARFFGLTDLLDELESLHMATQENKPMRRDEFLQILMTTPSTSELRCQGVDLSGADLSHLDLRKINFKHCRMVGTSLRGASLQGSQFHLANLAGACFDDAILAGVQMTRAVLEGASMKNCKFENSLDFANLEGANMKGVNLEGSQMSGANLRVTNLKGAMLKNCVLRDAVLAGADLENANLSCSDLQGANLRGANVVGTIFLDIVTPLHMVHLM